MVDRIAHGRREKGAKLSMALNGLGDRDIGKTKSTPELRPELAGTKGEHDEARMSSAPSEDQDYFKDRTEWC